MPAQILAADPLSKIEKKTLRSCESIIKRGVQTSVEVGMALKQIQEQQLYREQHPTFEEYAQNRWELSRAHAYRLIESAKVIEDLSPDGDVPTNEAQARPLSKVKDPEARQELWDEAQERAGEKQVTAKIVEEVVKEYLSQNPEEEVETAATSGSASQRSATNNTQAGSDESTSQGTATVSTLEINTNQGGLASWVWRPFVRENLRVAYKPENLSAPRHSAPPKNSDDVDDRTVFVCPDVDMFAGGITEEQREAVFEMMAKSTRWTFLVVTKSYQKACGYKFPGNAWLGAHVSNTEELIQAERGFAGASAPVKFLYLSPLAEEITLAAGGCGWDWVVIRDSEDQPEWRWVWDVTSQAYELGYSVFWDDELRVRPMERPAT